MRVRLNTISIPLMFNYNLLKAHTLLWELSYFNSTKVQL